MLKKICSNALLVLSLPSFSALAQTPIKSDFLAGSVQLVKIQKLTGDKLQISYKVPPDTYSNGVDYVIESEVIRIAIKRCYPQQPCSPSVTSTLTGNSGYPLMTRLPYHGEDIVMAYSDHDEKIDPSHITASSDTPYIDFLQFKNLEDAQAALDKIIPPGTSVKRDRDILETSAMNCDMESLRCSVSYPINSKEYGTVGRGNFDVEIIHSKGQSRKSESKVESIRLDYGTVFI